jgi:hypothetical protein
MVITIGSRLCYSIGFLILGSIISLGSAPSVEAQASAPNANNTRMGNRTTDASVTVHPGDSLPIGTILWQAPKARGTLKAKQIVIAVPSSARTPAASPDNSNSQSPE